MKSTFRFSAFAVMLLAAYASFVSADESRLDGYRGIWYSNQAQDDEYVYKYSGGLGTYCAKHRPFAVYVKEVGKTFFCYGGTVNKNLTLLHMVSYFDHKTGMVPRPKFLIDKKTTDAHDNPVISLDDKGHIWIFSSSHGTGTPSYIWVSKKPYDIDEFEQVHTKAFASKRFEANFSYTQPHYIPGRGFQFLMTLYHGGRFLFSSSSPDGRPVLLYITSGGWEAGPANSPRIWCSARWTGKKWDFQGSIESDNNYDMGSLYVEADGIWRIIGPTETGPQPYNPGGEVAMWTSKDRGVSWKKVKQLTANSEFNHTYCRRPLNAHPDFYALWADGHGRKLSESRLYFTNSTGDRVWRLPVKMEGDFAKPEIVK